MAINRTASPAHKIADQLKQEQVRVFERILNQVLNCVFDEINVIFNEVSGEIVRLTASEMRRMKYDSFEEDSEGKYADKFSKCRIKLRASASEDEADELEEYLQKIYRELWNSSIEKQFDDTWKKVVKYLLPKLDVEWANAIEDGYQHELLTSLAKLIPNNGKFKHALKNLFPQMMMRTVFLIHVWKGLIGKYRKEIAPSLACNRQWTTKQLEFLWDFLVCNWGSMIKDFYNPRLFVHASTLQSADALGLRLLLAGWCHYHSIRSANSFKNLGCLLKSVIDVDYYQCASQLDNIHWPKYLHRFRVEMRDLLFDETLNDDNHWVHKNDVLAIPVVIGLMNDHGEYYKSRINTALYKDDVGIESDRMLAGSLEESIGVVINNFQGSTKGKSPHRKKLLKATINGLADMTFTSVFAQYPLGLCDKVVEQAEAGLVRLVMDHPDVIHDSDISVNSAIPVCV
ncbi:MAG: hypothetical protein ACPG2Y_02190, partial [Acholeplasmataceae bacterium]